MASDGYKYGSVSTDEEIPADKSFDESNLYYMKEEERTKKEKLFKAVKLGVPIIIAVVMIVGLAYLLFNNFGYFYPGRGGQVTPSKHSSSSTTTSSSSSSSSSGSGSSHYENIATSVPIPEKTTTSSGGTCEAHPKCADLGLTGECCPAASGIKLNCCS